MKQKTIDIPIYCCKLTMILSEDLTYIEKKFKTISLKDFGAVTLQNESEYRHFVVAFTDASHLGNIAHEVVHIKNHIYIDCAMNVDRHNDEPEAYLTGWLFEQILKFLSGN